MEIIREKWNEILQRVRDEHELSEISFDTWIKPLTVHSVKDNLVTILVPSEKMGLEYVSKSTLFLLKWQSQKLPELIMISVLPFRKTSKKKRKNPCFRKILMLRT